VKPFIAFYFYRYFLVPLARILVFIFRPLLPKKLTSAIGLKNETPIYTKGDLRLPLSSNQDLMWIHAASGEIEYAKPVLREWKLKFPNSMVLVTYTSPTSLNIWRHIPDVDIAVPLPWDQPNAVRQFLEDYKPKRLCVTRTDLWPELLYQVRLKRIPIMLYSATFARTSNKTMFFVRALTEFCLRQIDLILVVSPEDKMNVEQLAPGKTAQVIGDTRFDQVQFRLSNPKKVSPLSFDQSFVIVAGSTWPEDELILLRDLKTLLAPPSGRRRKLILVPHEVDEIHIGAIIEALERQNLKPLLYTNITSEGQIHAQLREADVLIVDKVGILMEVYEFGQMAFVGGSFKSQVHSVMEPLASGLPTLVGPYFGNNREAQHFQQESLAQNNSLSMVRAILSTQDFHRAVELYEDEYYRNVDYKRDVKSRVLQFAGATAEVVRLMSHL
jgi:3-deoxy-D-manno-octulosonic-acid transferase